VAVIIRSKERSKPLVKNRNYRYGRNKEYARLAWARKNRQAFLGGRFRGSKVSKSWIRQIGFNPDLDIWYITPKGVFFEQIKSSKFRKPTISKDEIKNLEHFAKFVGMNSPFYWIGYILMQPYKSPIEIRLN